MFPCRENGFILDIRCVGWSIWSISSEEEKYWQQFQTINTGQEQKNNKIYQNMICKICKEDLWENQEQMKTVGNELRHYEYR